MSFNSKKYSKQYFCYTKWHTCTFQWVYCGRACMQVSYVANPISMTIDHVRDKAWSSCYLEFPFHSRNFFMFEGKSTKEMHLKPRVVWRSWSYEYRKSFKTILSIIVMGIIWNTRLRLLFGSPWKHRVYDTIIWNHSILSPTGIS